MNKNMMLTGLLAVSISALSGCGGGSSTRSSNTSNNLPHTISAANLQGVDVLARAPSIRSPKVTSDENTVTLSFFIVDYHPGLHNQFFINVDNNAATGFQFNNEVWDNTGADYVVEDGHLFKSTANDSSWSWNENVGEVNYSITGGSNGSNISVTINKSLLEGLGTIIKAGFVSRDANWDVKSFYPVSPIMQEYTINGTIQPPATDTVPPVIKLVGLKTDTVLVNTPYSDHGANAYDNVDGNISSRIQKTSNVDTSKIGIYHVSYTVSDQAGNTSSITRTVKVVAEASQGITIDGYSSDWQNIPPLVNTPQGIIKVTETSDKLYIMVQDDSRPKLYNTQLFLDVDGDAATGFQFGGSIWNQGGADYMIENNHLDKAKTNSSSWSWDYNVSTIESSRSDSYQLGNVVEYAIPKSTLQGLGRTLNIGYVHRDQDWQTNNVLPQGGLLSYTLSSTPQPTTVSNNVRQKLCVNPTVSQTHQAPAASLKEGVSYNGKTYQMKQESAENYALWVSQYGQSKKIRTFVSKHYAPKVYSLSGALYFITSLQRSSGLWRVNDDSVINVYTFSPYSPKILLNMAYIGQSNYSLINSGNPMGGSSSTALSYANRTEGTSGTIIRKTAYLRNQPDLDQLKFVYEQGKGFVAYSENNTRSIYLINDSSKTLEKIDSCH